MEALEQIDAKLSTILLDTEQKMLPTPSFWWSKELHARHLICYYWYIQLLFTCNRIHDETTLQWIRDALPEEYDVFQGNPNG
eukprot:7036333-Ditylum_brightwellii.AAC.1